MVLVHHDAVDIDIIISLAIWPLGLGVKKLTKGARVEIRSKQQVRGKR